MSVTISSVLGNSQRLDGGAMFGNAPRAVWETWLPPDSAGRIPLNCRCMYVEADGIKILCETGVGAFFDPKLRDRYGVLESEHVLLKNLELLGVNDKDIDYVILSHLHFDHAGGLLPDFAAIQAGNSALLFPHAKYIVSKTAFARAEAPHPRDRASFIPDLTTKLKESGRLILVDSKDALIPELSSRFAFFETHGHTPGHLHTLVRGDQKSVFFCGDLVPGLPWVHIPITMGYDRFAEQVIDEKREIYARAYKEHWTLFYTHDARFALSELSLDEKGRYSGINPVETVIRQFI